MSKMKAIKIFSVGRKWPEAYPKAPDDETLQYVIDVRGVIPDPGPTFPGQDGTTEAVRQWILAQDGVVDWLEWTFNGVILMWIQDMVVSDEFDQLHIVFMCKGGFQRSVFVAEYMAERIRQTCDSGCSVTHLTVELTRADDARKATT
jgi:RNase adaptor protein for sRNA GlmZ degradation